MFIDPARRNDGACFAGVAVIGGHTRLSGFRNRAAPSSAQAEALLLTAQTAKSKNWPGVISISDAREERIVSSAIGTCRPASMGMQEHHFLNFCPQKVLLKRGDVSRSLNQKALLLIRCVSLVSGYYDCLKLVFFEAPFIFDCYGIKTYFTDKKNREL